MKELGNLAIVMAKRFDTALIIHKGIITVCVGEGPDRVKMTAAWYDNEKIRTIVMALNHGNLKGAA